jgi:hypothetical protein
MRLLERHADEGFKRTLFVVSMLMLRMPGDSRIVEATIIPLKFKRHH